MRTESLSIARRCWLTALAGLLGLAAPLVADTTLTRERSITKLADGVYEIRHSDPSPGNVNGNTTVMIGEREVFVVDTCFTAAAAEEDIAQIRQWTSKPVRWVLNTHWHQDHFSGNAAYLRAFPGVSIVAHAETKRLLDATAPYIADAQVKYFAGLQEQMEHALAGGKDGSGKPLSAAHRKDLDDQRAQLPAMIAAAKAFAYQPPTLTFEDRLTIDLGGRQIEVGHPGRGNTGGDAIAYLPREKILVTGDLVVHPVPYTFDGYPSEWIKTFDVLAGYETTTIVPGHGEIEHDKTYLHQLHDLMAAVVTQVDAQVFRNHDVTLEEVKRHVDVKALRDQILGDDREDGPFFDYAIGALTGLAYHEAKAH